MSSLDSVFLVLFFFFFKFYYFLSTAYPLKSLDVFSFAFGFAFVDNGFIVRVLPDAYKTASLSGDQATE